jgi:sugar transferase EpsL
MEYLSLYTERQARRHEVRPGLTGWAQVNGRNALSWEEKFELDVWYVDHHSMWLDVRILWRTVWYVLAGSDVAQSGHVTAERFRGSAR